MHRPMLRALKLASEADDFTFAVSDASPDVEGIETTPVDESSSNAECQMHRPMLRALKLCLSQCVVELLRSDASPDVEGIET